MGPANKIHAIEVHLFLVCLCCFLSRSLAESNLFDWMPTPTTCTSESAPPSATGSPTEMPSWPRGFSVKIEASMKVGNWGYEAEEHVDSNNDLIASVRTNVAGNKQHTIFSADPSERYTIINDDTCLVTSGGRAFHPLAFASMSDTSIDPSMISFRQLIDFGVNGDDNFVYVGKTSSRNIPVNHWTSCQEWTDMSAKIQIDIYFSLPEYKSVWGQVEVPVRAEIKGTTGLFNSQYIPKGHQFENVYNFLSFQSGASFEPDPSEFEIPMRVVCVGGSNNKALPDLPDSFRMTVEPAPTELEILRWVSNDKDLPDIPDSFMRMNLIREILDISCPKRFNGVSSQQQLNTQLMAPHLGSSFPMNTELRYDWEHQLMESVRDFAQPIGVTGEKARHKPNSFFEDQEKNKQSQTDWITVKTYSTVEDYHTGLQYITEKNNNTCMVRPIPSSNSMTKGNMLLRLYKEQKHGEFQMSYQGFSRMRGIPVESWGMDRDEFVQKVFFLSRTKGPTDVKADTSNMTEKDGALFEKGIQKLQLTNLNKFPVLMGIVVRNRTAAGKKDFPMLVKDLLAQGVFAWYDEKLKLVTDEDPELLMTDDLVHKFYSWSRMQDMQVEHIGEMDVFVQHFTPLHMDVDLFHVSQCYKSEEVAKVILTVKESYNDNVLHNPNYFLNPLRSSIARSIGVSVIQLSDMEATPIVNHDEDIDAILVTFNLLGEPPMEENNREQQGLDVSKKRLVSSIQNGIAFTAKYAYDVKSFVVDKEHFVVGYNSLEDLPLFKRARNSNNSFGKTNIEKDNGDDDDKNKYSGGVVAGVAIAVAVITCGVTLLLAMLYLRSRRPDTSPAIPYVVDKA